MKVLVPLPDTDFDTTEVAVPWRLLTTPLSWSDLEVSAYDGLLLAGGHAPGMRQYLGSVLLTFWKLGRYYRTYPAYVEDEVVANLASPDNFQRGPRETKRGTRTDHRHAFVVEDGNYVSARWPGDSYLFAERFIERLES